MTRVLLVQIDGKIPNVAIMRLAHHHRALGDELEFRWGRVHRQLWDSFDRVYGSAIFEKSRLKAETLAREFPGAILGGTGWDDASSLEAVGVFTNEQDYSFYPGFRQSIGFSQRGCRLNCWFCKVPKKEGRVKHIGTIHSIWRGEPWPKEVLLLDNDFFGQKEWPALIDEIRAGGFKVSFNQGINARFLSDRACEAIASIDYRDDSMKVKRLYTAWDDRRDEHKLMNGLRRLEWYGVKPDHIMVYMLIGAPNQTIDDWLYRQRILREFGARPYPMPYVRTRESVGFQRWCVGAYDKRVPWEAWQRADFRPEKLTV